MCTSAKTWTTEDTFNESEEINLKSYDVEGQRHLNCNHDWNGDS